MNEQTPPTGLSEAQAAARLAADGPNTLEAARQRTTLAIALEVVREPMFLLLVGAAAVYLLLGSLREALVLSASVVVVIVITVVQERKTERALEALRDLSSPRALVLRDGVERRIAGAEVVRGDLLVLAEGDRVPADARLAAVNELLVDESLLTGEALPVEKRALGDGAAREGQVYSGTLVVKGQGRAVVTATGAHTEFGRIGGFLASLESEKTALQRETARAVKLIAAIGLALCVAVSLLYVAMRGDALDGILAGLTLAMAMVPEEFPVVLTVFLALGAWRIAKRGVLTRRMPAVEMLGAATVLCVDKTGTLTENRMALVEAYVEGGWRRLDGRGAPSHALAELLETAALACELEPFDPMERAILQGARRAAPRAERARRSWRLERDYPFSADFLAVCHGWRAPGGEGVVAIKGAPETVLALCALDEAARRAALEEAGRAAGRGLRLLAVGEARWHAPQWAEDARAYRFRWLGFVALADPLRASVPAAVAECRRAGIRVVMITGDYPATALAIAREAGIATDGAVLSGEDIARLDDAALARAVRGASVFARILPEQKLRLVSALKAAGEVVAMTGDGVNDAPALKAAHIGVAMGKRGTDVAREASALVLLEDDFGSIVETVRTGRRIYENIRNAMRYLIAVHVPTAGLSFVPLAFGWPLFLFPVHIVFLEFVIDPACSIVFEAEPSEEGAMHRPPRDPRRPLFDRAMLATGLGLGLSVLASVTLAYWWALDSGRSAGEVRALGFAAIVFGNLALILANLSGAQPLLEALRRPNRALWWVLGGTLAALGAAIYVAPVASLFRFAPLAPGDALVALAAGVAGVLWFELAKLLRRPRGRAAR
ncbi:MAG: cation-translocating P-type ATPase [Betaproteobacteria bacterium]|nr:cation-translocating P-type ATPase [Betaproteobacteria bacterium]